MMKAAADPMSSADLPAIWENQPPMRLPRGSPIVADLTFNNGEEQAKGRAGSALRPTRQVATLKDRGVRFWLTRVYRC